MLRARNLGVLSRSVRAAFGKEIFKDTERAAEAEYMRAQDAEKMRKLKARNRAPVYTEQPMHEASVDEILEKRERLLQLLEENQVAVSEKLVKQLLNWKFSDSKH